MTDSLANYKSRVDALRRRAARLLEPGLAARTEVTIGPGTVDAPLECRFVPAPPLGRQPLSGTYVGNGRVLVYLETGDRLYISDQDITLVPELLKDGIYDVPFTRFLHRTLQKDSVFVDVGANVGLFTVIGGYLAWTGRVIAYEPAPALTALLRDNVAANWMAERVTIRDVAVADASGRATFGFPATMHTLGGLDLRPERFAELYPNVPVIEHDVEVVCLDNELADVRHIDLVKIDVEGGEADVLKGLRSTIAQGRVGQISLEVRRDAHERNRSGRGWNDLIDELDRLCANGAHLGAPDEAGVLREVTMAEVRDVALYANLVVSLNA